MGGRGRDRRSRWQAWGRCCGRAGSPSAAGAAGLVTRTRECAGMTAQGFAVPHDSGHLLPGDLNRSPMGPADGVPGFSSECLLGSAVTALLGLICSLEQNVRPRAGSQPLRRELQLPGLSPLGPAGRGGLAGLTQSRRSEQGIN